MKTEGSTIVGPVYGQSLKSQTLVSPTAKCPGSGKVLTSPPLQGRVVLSAMGGLGISHIREQRFRDHICAGTMTQGREVP